MRRLRHRFDNLISRGVWAMTGLLAVVAPVMAAAGAAAVLAPFRPGAATHPAGAHRAEPT
ncbi:MULTISPECIES: hypothetical protein [Streptosporangium]|uniref:Uncharacterized protein n=1 Tax=Streptosporangium brasiliense TaxID=47480 RepID=A0ABT9R8V1_9ACTN|nr:hypothetical protein [Streptosporangium brasiliense]MDP9865674.1 hypothetical protein [Streptosporangium brasiliense]